MMECRPGCGVCCIIPSINTPFNGMPNGKPAGTPCVHLAKDYRCKLFNSSLRPDFCIKFQAEKIVCGNTREEAINKLAELEGIDLKKL